MRILFSTNEGPPRTAEIDFGISIPLELKTGQLYAKFNQLKPEGCAGITHAAETKPSVYDVQATLSGDFSMAVGYFIHAVMTMLGWNPETTTVIETLNDGERRWSLGTIKQIDWVLIQPQ